MIYTILPIKDRPAKKGRIIYPVTSAKIMSGCAEQPCRSLMAYGFSFAMPNEPSDAEILTIIEIAEYLKVTERTTC